MAIRADDTRMVLEQASTPAVSRALQALLTWRRLCLMAILALSAALEFIGLGDEGYANTYYAAGVKSMLTSWHNFFFVSFDAGGFVSLDKPPLGLWIEAASARLFGFSGVSMLLPEALAGVLSVALLYHLVSRSFGGVAGLIAALMLAVTPISAILDRNNTIDSLLILTLLGAAWAVSLAAERASLRWLLCSALLAGMAFNIKMLQAYLVVPALLLVYLLGARLQWRTRMLHLALALVVLLVVSFSWVAIVDLTPASQRPFISDSGTNSELSLVLGYNGLGRLTQALFPGVSQIRIFGDPIDLTIVPAFAPNIGNPGPLRLLSSALGGQASWFLLPALAGFLAMVRRARPRLPLDRQGQGLVLWGGWLVTAGVFFSTARFFHLYYLVMLAPAIAALGGIGLTALWREYQRACESGQPAFWRGWLLPVTLVATGILQVQFLDGYPDWSSLLALLIIGSTVLAAALLVAGRLRVRLLLAPELLMQVTRPIAVGCTVLGLGALLAAPSTWAIAAIANGEGGAWLPQAGPANQGFGGRPGAGFGQGRGGFPFSTAGNGTRFNGRQGGFPTGPGQGGAGANGSPNGAAPFPGPAQGSGTGGGFTFPGGRGRFAFGGGGGASTFAGSQIPALDAKLLHYLQANQGSARYLVATTTSSYASLFILDTNQPAMALGGYQGWDRILTPATLAERVAAGTVRFFYLPGVRGSGRQQGQTLPNRGQGAGAGSLATVNDDLTSWVQSSCAVVPTSRWQTTSSSSTNAQRGFGGSALQVYDCAAPATGH